MDRLLGLAAKLAMAELGGMQMVEREYQELFENQVQVVHPVYKPQDMTALCKEYEGLRKRLIDQVDQYEVKMRKGKKIKRKTVGPVATCCDCV